MDKFKILATFLLLATTSLATVKVVSPVNQELGPGETLDLTGEKPYESGYKLVLKIEKDDWDNVSAENLSTTVERVNGSYLKAVFDIPSETGENTINVTFHNCSDWITDNETNASFKFCDTQSNKIKYEAEEVSLQANMVYPLNRKLPEDKRINIGTIAPGQEMNLLFARKSLFYANAPPFYWEEITANGGSDYYNVPKQKPLEDILPPETIEEKKLGEETYLAINLEAPMKTGEHDFQITLNSPFSSSIKRNLSVKVKKDVYDVKTPGNMEIKAGEQKNIPITIESHSIAIEHFTFTPKQLPEEWITGPKGKEEFNVKVRPEEKKKVNLPIKINQEGRYKAIYKLEDSKGVWSEEAPITITATPTTKSKLHGFKKGHSLTLPLLQPFYSILSLFG